MSSAVLAWIVVPLLAVTATGLLLSRDWRWELGLLAIQYLGAAVLVAQHLPLGMAATKLVAGWMTTAALGMTLTVIPEIKQGAEEYWPQGRVFRLFMAGTILVLATAITPRIDAAMVGIGAPVIAGTLLLTGMGLLQLGTSQRMPRVIFGLLTVLLGFEVFYAAVESSILVAGLLALVNLGLGLVGAYLLVAASSEEVL